MPAWSRREVASLLYGAGKLAPPWAQLWWSHADHLVGTLKAFWEHPAHRFAEQPLRTWIKAVQGGTVDRSAGSQADVRKRRYPDGRVVFDIGGNKYRLVARVNYQYGVVYVRFIGTHRDYDKIDAQSV
jgi:mRNA interferase HigB